VRVTVVVPFRGDAGWRNRVWVWVQRWWAAHYPGWQVVAGACPDGPWVKAAAVADALTRATGDILVLADADVVCVGAGEAARKVASGAAPWAVPHGQVRRLSAQATDLVLAGADPSAAMAGLARPPYRGVEGGGLVVLPRTCYEQAPLDPRFVGWGSEDEALALALRTMVGKPWRGTDVLWHLWHDPQPRLNQHVGSAASHALLTRYQFAAKEGRPAMRRLLTEAAGDALADRRP
jgi:hypothetical protein